MIRIAFRENRRIRNIYEMGLSGEDEGKNIRSLSTVTLMRDSKNDLP